MDTQAIIFFSALCTLAFVLGKYLGYKESKPEAAFKEIGGSIREFIKEIKEEPEVEQELDLKESFADRFRLLEKLRDESRELDKKMDNERESLWEEVRKDYNIGEKNLSVNDDYTKLKVMKPSRLESMLAKRLK